MAQVDIDKFNEEAKSMTNYIDGYYTKRVPPPELPNLSFFKLAGFEAVTFAIPATAMALFSAIRTGQFFYILELLLLEKFALAGQGASLVGFIVAILALVGFEGYILARGLKQGRTQRNVKESWWATIFSFAIILSVGVFSSLELLDNINITLMLWINIFMVIITGLGSGFIVFFGGKDIGIAIRNFDVEKVKLVANYQVRYDEWRVKALQSWNAVKGSNSRRSPSPAPDEAGDSQNASSDWRKVKLTLSDTQMLELANLDLSDKDLKSQWATDFGVVEKTIENWHENALRFVTADMLSLFIKDNGRFPTSEEMTTMRLQQGAVAFFVTKNEKYLLENNLISQKFVEDARNLV